MRDSLMVTIEQTRVENPDVVTLYFTRPFEFVAGQYITVYIDGSAVREGKAYSLSSSPHEAMASITVKNVGGEYSSYLCSRQPGDTIAISKAYGHFNPHTTKPLVGITAGCGLSPIWSIMNDHSAAAQQKMLFFSHKTAQHGVFDQELERSPIDVTHFSTREPVKEEGSWRNGRFDVATIVEKAPAEGHYLVCGGISFVRDVWEKLTSCGVQADRISTETFFET